MTAEVIPDESAGFYGRAECPECGWQGPRRIYPVVTQRDADRHNERAHPDREDGSEPC